MSCGSLTSVRRHCTVRSFCEVEALEESRILCRMLEKKTPISDLRWSLKKTWLGLGLGLGLGLP